jgi:hypothetical protein
MIEPEGSKYAHFLYDICKYLCYGIESAGYSCCILRNRLASDRVNVLMGAHNLTDPTIAETIKKTGPYILLQSEIITGDTINHWPHQKAFQDIYLPLMREASAVWTGVQANVEALKNLEIELPSPDGGNSPQNRQGYRFSLLRLDHTASEKTVGRVKGSGRKCFHHVRRCRHVPQ